MSAPVGVLGVAFVYATAAITVKQTAPLCINEPCNSEGVDNSIAGWATDFFVAIGTGAFALHLLASRSGGRRIYTEGIVAQAAMCIAYILGGLGHWIFPNTPLEDGKGQAGFFLSWSISFFFLTISTLALTSFATKVMNDVEMDISPVNCCSLKFLKVLTGLVVGCCMLVSSGASWCLLSPDVLTPDIIDSYNATDATPNCYQLMFLGEGSMYLIYAAYWVAFGSVMYSVCRAIPKTLMGLPTTTASGALPFIACTFGIMYIPWAGVVSVIVDEDPTVVYELMRGAMVYHFGMLLTFFLSHNLSYSYPAPSSTEKMMTAQELSFNEL